MIRVASIGCGDIARRRHFPELAALGARARLVAVAARDEARLADCAREFDVPDTYRDVDEMLARDDVDAVLVLTPPGSHAHHIRRAIEAGKHVLVEKPMVMSTAEAADVLRALEARATPRPVTCLALPHVDIPEHRLVARLVADGVIGEPTSVECHRGHRGPTHAGWFYDRSLAGGGVLFDLGIYQIAAVLFLFGPAISVAALCTRRFEARTLDDGRVVRPDVEDSALVNLWLARGIGVTVNANWNGYASHHETRKRVSVFGREGCLHFGVADGAVYVHRGDGDYAALPAGAEHANFDGYAGRRISPADDAPAPTIVGDFIERIERGDTSSRALELQVHAMEIVFEAYRAGEENAARRLATRF